MFPWLTRRRLLVISAIVTLALATVSGTSGSQSVEVDSSASTYSLQSGQAGTATSGTPAHLMRDVYYSGATVYGKQIQWNGVLTTPNLTRVLATNGFHYAVVAFQGEYYAIDETNASVWDTHGNPYGNSAYWSMVVVTKLIELARWILSWDDIMLDTVMALLLIFAIFLLILFALIRWFYLKKWDKERKDRFGISTQWSNSLGLILYDYVPFYDEAGFYHPGLRADLNWLAGADTDFRSDIARGDQRFGGVFSEWLATGTFTPPPVFVP